MKTSLELTFIPDFAFEFMFIPQMRCGIGIEWNFEDNTATVRNVCHAWARRQASAILRKSAEGISVVAGSRRQLAMKRSE